MRRRPLTLRALVGSPALVTRGLSSTLLYSTFAGWSYLGVYGFVRGKLLPMGMATGERNGNGLAQQSSASSGAEMYRRVICAGLVSGYVASIGSWALVLPLDTWRSHQQIA